MTPVACRYCGLPFKVRRVEPGREYFCCTGCAMLARVPVDAQGQFPVNGQLVSALLTGFLYFNQLLFWGLAALLVRDETQQVLAGRFVGLSLGTALAVWLAILAIQLREKSFRGGDGAVAAFVLLAHGAALWSPAVSLVGMAAANAVFLLWSLRGLLRRKRAA